MLMKVILSHPGITSSNELTHEWTWTLHDHLQQIVQYTICDSAVAFTGLMCISITSQPTSWPRSLVDSEGNGCLIHCVSPLTYFQMSAIWILTK